jgi:hypothetical protein
MAAKNRALHGADGHLKHLNQGMPRVHQLPPSVLGVGDVLIPPPLAKRVTRRWKPRNTEKFFGWYRVFLYLRSRAQSRCPLDRGPRPIKHRADDFGWIFHIAEREIRDSGVFNVIEVCKDALAFGGV